MSDRAFSALGNNATVAAGVVSVSAALPGTPAGGQFVRVYNGTAAPAFWRAGAGTQVSVLTDTFIGPGNTEVFGLPADADTVGLILASGAGNVYFQRGAGL